jgi:hypothetical protein
MERIKKLSESIKKEKKVSLENQEDAEISLVDDQDQGHVEILDHAEALTPILCQEITLSPCKENESEIFVSTTEYLFKLFPNSLIP